jgi:hypothetical protein
MADPAPQEPRFDGFSDRTRDIRLPPPPGSPPVVVRPEWSSYTARQQPVQAESAPTEAAPAPTIDIGKPSPRRPQDLLADEPTDQLVQPGRPPRERTLEFAQGEAMPAQSVSAPAAPAVAQRTGSRRWVWVLMALLPIIVIVGSGIWLFVLLSHA